MPKVVLLVIALSLAAVVDAKVYLSCELAKEFSRNEMERHLIPHWICLVQAESQGNTSKIVDMPNLTANYGIFQVKELFGLLIARDF
jgi:C-type lysozyme/alpha-lactalbumin family